MNSGTISASKVASLAFSQVNDPDGILAIFAGSVCWETKEQFDEGCSSGGEHDLMRLLEIRVYSKECEFHAARDSIGEEKELSWRTVADDDFDGYQDEEQYLDIDNARSDTSQRRYTSTGGGEYTLPVANAERIHLRNYIKYDDEGVAHFIDYRIVGLLKEGE